MLGWEFPPFISGGLGTACYGLTKALDRLGHRVIFVLPRPVDRAFASHVELLSPDAARARASAATHEARAEVGGDAGADADPADAFDGAPPLPGFTHTVFRGVRASFSSPYPGFSPVGGVRGGQGGAEAGAPGSIDAAGNWTPAPGQAWYFPADAGPIGGGSSGAGVSYGVDLVGDSERYARLVVAMAAGETFDVIHAHDWLTYPAGLALARVSGKPLVVHVHSTEFDRAGNNVNQRVYDIERAGVHGAHRVVAVSNLTRAILAARYEVPADKVDVVYNGVDRESGQPAEGVRVEEGDKIVLFLGRITMQKGPEYFIAAAKRVLEKYQDVKFLIAGSGDMALRMVELAANMGIGHKVLFTGFLRGRDVDRAFAMADCYVMPSVSEPFGIAALEAIHHDVPVIVSKSSGVAEVLTHALKVDFWDIDEMANKIVAVLRHPPLSQTLRQHGTMELHRLTWAEAAQRCVRSYERAGARATH